MASSTLSAEGCTYLFDIAIELCPAILAKVQTSQPDSPKRVRNLCRKLYKTNGRTLLALMAFLCCFFTVDGSTCPLFVGAGQTQPSAGFSAASHRRSRNERRRTREILRFLRRWQNVLAVALPRLQLELRSAVEFSPFHCKVKDAAQDSQARIDRTGQQRRPAESLCPDLRGEVRDVLARDL